MRRGLGLATVLFLSSQAAALAAVVERLSPSLGLTGAPIPVLSISMSGAASASFTPALTAAISAPSLSAASPIPSISPVLLPSLPAPVISVQPGVVTTPALAAAPLPAPAFAHDARGPPNASEFSSFVAKSVADALRDWSVPSSEILEDHDALLVGENHQSLASVTELTRALPGLARAGVKVLGIEGLKRPNQAAVDAYLSGSANALPDEVLAFSPRRRLAFAALLKAARETGVRVVALGVPLDVWAREAADLAAQKTGDPVESFYAAPGEQLYRAQKGYEPGFNEAVAEVYLSRRNRSMALFLAEAMVQGAKAVVLVGQNHVEGADDIPASILRAPGDWGSMSRELARLGLKAFSLTLTGGRYVDADGAKDDRQARRSSYERAAKASPHGAPAFERTGVNTGLYHAGGTVPAALIAH